LIGEHALSVELGGRALQAQAQSGDVAGARAALSALDPPVRNRAAMRIAANAGFDRKSDR